MIGLNRGTTPAHIARAALESIAFQTLDVLQVMEQDTNLKIHELRVDGGASASNLLMQMQADLLGIPVVRPRVTESTAAGAACLAGLATGFWKDINEIAGQWQRDLVFSPSADPNLARIKKLRWADAVKRSGRWERE
jgi:glycerol kinase